MSSPPYASTAVRTNRSAKPGSVTLPTQATAMPPAASIAATVSLAGPSSRSLTTTRAPAAPAPRRPARPATLPHQLGTRGRAGGAQRVPLGQQAAGRVDHAPPAVGVVPVFDELLGGTLRGQPERLVAEHLVGGEAVV